MSEENQPLVCVDDANLLGENNTAQIDMGR
jgi:hypothetical protein